MSPSISISVSNDIYQLIVEYRNETNLTQSAAGASLIKMGFAWHKQNEWIREEQNQTKQERNAIKTVSVKAITKAVKTAQKSKVQS